MVTLTTCKYNTWHFFWRVPVMHAGHLWVTPSKSWCIRTNTCPKNKLTRRKFRRKKNNKYYNLYLHVGFFFFYKKLEKMMFCRQSIHIFTFVIHFNTHSFHFSVFLRNPQSEEKRKYMYPKGSRRFQYNWYE